MQNSRIAGFAGPTWDFPEVGKGVFGGCALDKEKTGWIREGEYKSTDGEVGVGWVGYEILGERNGVVG